MYERGGRLGDRPARFLARREGSLWSVYEVRARQVEDIEVLHERLRMWTRFGATAGAPWSGEMAFEASGHVFTVFERTQGLALLQHDRFQADPDVAAWVGSLKAAALETCPEEGCPLSFWVGRDARVVVRPMLLAPDPDGDDPGDPWEASSGAASHASFVSATASWLPAACDDARHAVEVATQLLDGVDPEGLPFELERSLLDHRDSAHAWAVAHDWLLARQLPRGELVLLGDSPSHQTERNALLERYVELGLGDLPYGTELEWRHGYVWAIDLVPMAASTLRALLEHPSCRFLHTLRLKVKHFVDAVELLGDLVAIGHDAVRVIDAPPSVFTAEFTALRRAFLRLQG